MKMEMKDRFVRSPSVVARNIAGECVLVPIRDNARDLDTIYTLNEVGREIWEMMDGKHTLEEILGELRDRFDAPEDELRRDLLGFARDLASLCCVEAK